MCFFLSLSKSEIIHFSHLSGLFTTRIQFNWEVLILWDIKVRILFLKKTDFSNSWCVGNVLMEPKLEPKFSIDSCEIQLSGREFASVQSPTASKQNKTTNSWVLNFNTGILNLFFLIKDGSCSMAGILFIILLKILFLPFSISQILLYPLQTFLLVLVVLFCLCWMSDSCDFS